MVSVADVNWNFVLHNSIGCEILVKVPIKETIIKPDFRRLQEPIEKYAEFYELFKFPKGV